MATRIAIKYTDETYATHRDLQNALRMSLIGDFWKDIEEYRKENAKRLLIKTIGGQPFYYVETPSLKAKYNSYLSLLERYHNAYDELYDLPSVKKRVDKAFLENALNNMAKLSGLDVSDPTLKAIASAMYDNFGSGDAGELSLLTGYRDILKGFANSNSFDNDTLFRDYAYLLGEEELTSFYREIDNAPQASRGYSISDRFYEEAPAEKIDMLMDALFAFHSVDPTPSFYKAIMTGYYLLYVKPFDNANQALAVLSLKRILGGHGTEYLPFELSFMDSPRLSEINKEIQSSGDLTFLIMHLIEQTTPTIRMMLDKIATEKRASLEEEAYTPKVEKKPDPIPEPAPKEEAEEVKEELEEVEQLEEMQVAPSKIELALSAPAESMSDKDIKDAARFLLETHPMLRKQQALFFASHCTMGRYYSIQDYKRYSKCVYETARTSMDNLAREKLYKKLKIKNKFVYTPIRQGDNQ